MCYKISVLHHVFLPLRLLTKSVSSMCYVAIILVIYYIHQTCLLVRLNRILYDLHVKLRQYVFKRRSTVLRYLKRRFDRCKDSQLKRKQRYLCYTRWAY